MALTIKPKQAFGFLPARNCICNSPYCQPIVTTDSLMLQGTVDEATGDNLLLNGEFTSASNWTLGAGWSIAGGKLVATNITGTTAVSIAELGLVVGKLYLIQIQVTVTSVGSAGVNDGWFVSVNSDYMQLPNSTPLGQGYNQSLTASWVYSPAVDNDQIVTFGTDENTIDFNVEYVRIYELSEVGIAIYRGETLEGTITSFSGSNSLKYYFNGDLFMTNGALIGGVTNILLASVANVSVLWELFINTWSSITSETGCLTARFYDTLFLTNRMRNGTFTGNADYWTLVAGIDGGWAYGAANSICYASAGAIVPASQTVNLMGGVRYLLSVTITGATGNEGINVTYTINGGAPITAAQNFVYIIDLTLQTGIVSVEIFIQVDTLTDTLCIDDVILVAEEADELNVTNCINIQTEQPCTIQLYATNLDNAFGLDYVTGALRHYLRVYGKIKYSDYPEEAEVFKFSNNSNQIMFASSEKQFEVIIGDAPEQIHDCIVILRLHDIFQIDSIDYVRSGNYDLNRRRSSDNSQAIFTVKEQDGVSSNYSCQ